MKIVFEFRFIYLQISINTDGNYFNILQAWRLQRKMLQKISGRMGTAMNVDSLVGLNNRKRFLRTYVLNRNFHIYFLPKILLHCIKIIIKKSGIRNFVI